MKYSGKKLTWFDSVENKHIIPAVIESSSGVDRTVLTVLSDAYHEEEVGGEKRVLLKLHPKLSPIKVAIFPLINKNELPEIAKKLADNLSQHFSIFYDSSGSIGKRYRRQDEAGTPYGITIDLDTLKDNCVTIRNRDTMKQERINIDSSQEFLNKHIYKVE